MTGQDDAPGYQVREIGSYFIGGHVQALRGLPVETVRYFKGAQPMPYDPNGDVHAGQMYVHFVRLQQPRSKLPVILMHGGALTGTGWESTPDGRPGWQHFFLRAGFDVIVPDQMERGRSNWSRDTRSYDSPPLFRTAEEAWTLYRIGQTYATDPAARVAPPGCLFPIESFDAFLASFSARWTATETAAQAAFDQLVDKEGPCILVAHSAGSGLAIRTALRAPEKVAALVGLEPSAAPDPATVEMGRLTDIPMLFVWGDYMADFPDWERIMINPTRFSDAQAAQGRMEVIRLPEHGIHGNSHMLMMDRNSDQVAGLVRDWLVAQKIVQPRSPLWQLRAMEPSAKTSMTAEEFLDWAMIQPEGERYQLVDGEVFAIASERLRHALVKGEVFYCLKQAVRKSGLPCTVFPDGMAVRIDDLTVYEPDAAVRCGDPLPDDCISYDDPVIVVEVLSPSTSGIDTGDKLMSYFRIPSVQHYLIVSTSKSVLIHHGRQIDGTIQTRILASGELRLDPPGIVVDVAALFP